MLTRLKVNGFKNLVDVDVRFGPFSCIAGANGVGKSNLFDAIRFLSALADRSLLEAALSVREEGGGLPEVRSLFHRVGDDYDSKMSFEAEMIIPPTGVDDLGQEAVATRTFLRYTLVLAYSPGEGPDAANPIQIVKEELATVSKNEAHKPAGFPHSEEWFRSVVIGSGKLTPFILTEQTDTGSVIKLGDNRRGRRLLSSAASLPRTVLSASNASDSPTAALARREMQSWRLLQLEPSSLRKSDEWTASPRLERDGSHLPAMLYRLARTNPHYAGANGTEEQRTAHLYGQLANRLAELIEDVRDVWVDRDQRRETLTLYVRSRDLTSHPARSLSDGTLRFLALAALELDVSAGGLICLEEPENGIHPARIPAMLRLLQDIASDATTPAEPGIPLRQVIVNTHSPAVVMEIPEDSLLVAELKDTVSDHRHFNRVSFGFLPGTWRDDGKTPTTPMGQLLAYLNPIRPEPPVEDTASGAVSVRKRVVDRSDIQILLPLFGDR